MNWVLDHAELLTAAAIFVVPLAFALFIAYLYRNTPEVSDVQGEPETLGDFPPLGFWGDKEAVIKSLKAIEGVGEFPAGAYIHVSPDGDHAVLATAETHNAIADGKGGYIK